MTSITRLRERFARRRAEARRWTENYAAAMATGDALATDRSASVRRAERVSIAALVLVASLSLAAAIIVASIIWRALTKGAGQ